MTAARLSAPGITSRSGAADVLKMIAILSVVVLHSSTDGYYTAMGSFDWYASLLWGCLSRAGVPVFLMVSGALTLNPEWDCSLKKLWTRSIPRLYVAMIVWAFGYRLFRLLFITDNLSAATLWDAIKHTFALHHEFHLYYMHIILLVYAILPLTRLITAHADRRTLEYILGLWFLLGIFLPTFKNVWPFTLLEGIPTQYPIKLAYSAIGYTLLGWYLRKYAVSWKKWAVTALVGLCMVYGGTVFFSLRAGTLVTGALEGTSPGVMVMGVGICGAAFAGLREKAAPRWCQILARASFCIFLVHVFFLIVFNRLGLSAITGPCIVFVPILAAAILICSLAVWFLLSRIPVARNWLI